MLTFRYQQDRLPIALFAMLFGLDLAVFLFVENSYLVLTWALLGLGPKSFIGSWNHHHQHCPTFAETWANRALELIYAFQTGITTNAWVLHHNLGHHLHYLDQSKDESRWKRADGSTMGCIEYTTKLALTGYLRAYQVGKRHQRFQKTFFQMGTIVAALLIAALFFNWRNALLLFVLPMIVGYIGTCWHTYYHHAGLDTDDPHEASYNVMHKWYNVCTGNLGYHTAHHMKQALHWSQLPEYHASIAHKIPDHLYRPPCIPFCWIKG